MNLNNKDLARKHRKTVAKTPEVHRKTIVSTPDNEKSKALKRQYSFLTFEFQKDDD